MRISSLLADSVEKVLAAVGTKFLRAADAFNAVRHGGPRRPEQKLSATFFFAWKTHPQKKSPPGKLLREFRLGSIFDFFKKIGQLQTNFAEEPSGEAHQKSAPRSCVTAATDRLATQLGAGSNVAH
jgi:hypothetical protein